MDQQLVREIMASGSAMLTQMAEAAKTTGEHLYGVLVRQQLVEGIKNVAGIPLYLILWWIMVKKSWAYEKENYNGNDKGFGTALIAIFGGLILSIFVSLFIDGVAHLINPEYYAIKFIIDSVQNR